MTDDDAEKRQDEYDEQVREWERQAETLSRKLIEEDEAVYEGVLDAIVAYETTLIEHRLKNSYTEHLGLISHLLYAIYKHAQKSSELRSMVIKLASSLIPQEPISNLVQ